MPNVWAIRTGLWSTGSTWNTGTVPTSADDVFISGSGFTVTIDQDVNVLSLNTISTGSIAAGGSFSVTESRNLNVGLVRAGSANCLNITGTSITVNITGSVSGSNSTSVSTVNITTVSSSINISSSFLIGGLGGSGNSPAVNGVGTSNTFRVVGNLLAGTTAGNNSGFLLAGSQNTLIVTGSVVGGSVTNNQSINGITVSSTNPYTLLILGNITGGLWAPAINVTGTGRGLVNIVGSTIGGSGNSQLGITIGNANISITGSITGGSSGVGLSLGSTSTLSISGSITGGTGAGGASITGNSNTVSITGSCTGGTGVGTAALNIGGTFNQVSMLGDSIGGPASSFGQARGVALGGTFNNLIVNGNVVGSPLATSLGSGLIILSATEPTCTIFGDVVPSRFGAGLEIRGMTGGVINIFGNVRGSAVSAANIGSITFAVFGTDRATLNISGSILPGEPGSGYTAGNTVGIRFDTIVVSNSTINISGSVYAGGTGSINVIGIQNFSSLRYSTINILGDVIAGPTGSSTGNFGITSNTTDNVITVRGSVIAGSANAIQNTANSTTITVGTAVASVTASGVSNTGNIPVIYEAATFATNGVIPITGPALLRQSNNNFFSCSLDTTGYKTLINVNNVSNGLPAASNVRRGTTYNFGDGVGTMAVPSASYVDTGVAVGNTVGTGVYTTASLLSTVWNTNVSALTASNSVGERLRNISTVSSTGDQLIALL